MEHFKMFLHSGGIFPHKCLLTDLALAPSDFLVKLIFGFFIFGAELEAEASDSSIMRNSSTVLQYELITNAGVRNNN